MGSDKPKLSRIGLATAQSILLPLIIASILSCSILINAIYRTEKVHLIREIDFHGQTLVSALQESLWLFDDDLSRKFIEEAYKFELIRYVKLTDHFGDNYQIGQLHSSTTVIRNYTIEREFRGETVELGTLQLAGDTQLLAKDSILLATYQTLIFLTTTLLASLVIYLHLKNNLLKHLNTITSKLKSSRNYPQNFKIQLDRDAQKSDELDDLVESIHHMHHQLLSTRETSKYTEGKLKGVAAFTEIAHCTIDLNRFVFVHVDQTFVDLMEFSPSDINTDSVIDELAPRRFTPQSLEMIPDIVDRVLRFESVENILEVNLPSGRRKFVRHLFTPLPMGQNGERLVDMLALDVTEVYEMQERLLQTQKVQAIGKLTGGVAHDVNNILAIISGNIELSQMLNKNPKISEYLSIALTATHRGAGLTQQLLAFARQQPLSPKSISPSDLIAESAELIRTTTGEHINIQTEKNDTIWRCTADEAQLQAVILNLASNAHDAMPDGGDLSISISNETLDEEYCKSNVEVTPGDYICICVSDTGIGMDSGILQKVIEPFFTTKPVGAGTGLGLSMAFGFAKQSHGHLQINSQVDVGTCVRLYLPRDKGTSQQKQIQKIEDISSVLSGKTLLLIEDDRVLQKVYTQQLSESGCTILCASDGKQAIDLASKSPRIDFILSDVILPNGMNGNAACEEIFKLHPNAVTLFMSGYTGASDFGQGSLINHRRVLQKPFGRAQLHNAIVEEFANSKQ